MPVDRSAVRSAEPSSEVAADPSHEDAVDPRREASPGPPFDHRSESPDAPTDRGPGVPVMARAVDRSHAQRR